MTENYMIYHIQIIWYIIFKLYDTQVYVTNAGISLEFPCVPFNTIHHLYVGRWSKAPYKQMMQFRTSVDLKYTWPNSYITGR